MRTYWWAEQRWTLWLASWVMYLWARAYRVYDRAAIALGPSPLRRWRGRVRG